MNIKLRRYATTINIFGYKLHSTSYLTNWPTWSLNAAWVTVIQRNNLIMTYQRIEARNHFPYKTRNPSGTLKTHGTPLNALRNPC